MAKPRIAFPSPNRLVRLGWVLCLLTGCAAAQNLQGGGDNFGSGWRKDSQGNWVGTGDNFGKTWRADRDGNLQGGGENFGKG